MLSFMRSARSARYSVALCADRRREKRAWTVQCIAVARTSSALSHSGRKESSNAAKSRAVVAAHRHVAAGVLAAVVRTRQQLSKHWGRTPGPATLPAAPLDVSARVDGLLDRLR